MEAERKSHLRSRPSSLLRCCFFLILLKVLLAIGLSLFFLKYLWMHNQRKLELTRLRNTEIIIPGVINENDEFHYDSIPEDNVLDSTFATEVPMREHQLNVSNGRLVDATTVRPAYFLENKNMDFPHALKILKDMVKCSNRELKSKIYQHNGFWVLSNYFHAGHGEIDCHTSVTYSTSGTFKNLGSLVELAKRWEAPVSVALYAPGDNFQYTLESLYYVLNCLPESPVLRLFVSFHIYFDNDKVPNFVWKHQRYEAQSVEAVNCSGTPVFEAVPFNKSCGSGEEMLYPANVGRNLARDAAITHFILEAELDMYPSLGLSRNFLEMIANSKDVLPETIPRVFALPVFGLSVGVPIPSTAVELQSLNEEGGSRLLADDSCYRCNILSTEINLTNTSENDAPYVAYVVKRKGQYRNWQPFFIGTVDEPFHNERISSESGFSRNAQAYTLCTLDYEFHLLGNAYLIRRDLPESDGAASNIQQKSLDGVRDRTQEFLLTVLYPNLMKIFGFRRGCSMVEKIRNFNESTLRSLGSF